jgi:hypothetical protein
MYEENGKWKIAHRIKRSHSIYSSPISGTPLVFDTLKKAQKALQPTLIGNYVPEGTKIFELTDKDRIDELESIVRADNQTMQNMYDTNMEAAWSKKSGELQSRYEEKYGINFYDQVIGAGSPHDG